MLLRHATLLRHDFEETLGSGNIAFGLAVAVLLLPAVTFQGWGWLPLWWLAVLFIYMSPMEKGVGGPRAPGRPRRRAGRGRRGVAAARAAEPAVPGLDAGRRGRARLARHLAARGRGARRTRTTATCSTCSPSSTRRRDGTWTPATIYKEILRASPTDSFALNNLANVEFAGGRVPRGHRALQAGHRLRAAAPTSPRPSTTTCPSPTSSASSTSPRRKRGRRPTASPAG